MTEQLELHVNADARDQLLEKGLSPELFSLFVGASGGPKWLVLSQLDRVLMPWLAASQRQQPLASIGSSIGAWRAICLAQSDPAAAIERLEQGYIEQQYDTRPTPEELSAVSAGILSNALGPSGRDEVLSNDRIRTHVITARGLGRWNSRNRYSLMRASAGTVVANTLSRRRLGGQLQRCCFHTGSSPLVSVNDELPTRNIALNHDNLLPATLASGSIPLLMRGVDELHPGEIHWDGGMTDYHFSPAISAGSGLTLYPHFYPYASPGWFDKLSRSRRVYAKQWPGLVLMCPSARFVQSLPGRRIPTRKDFETLDTASRKKAWWTVTEAGKRLADEFMSLLDHSTLVRRLEHE